MNTPTLVGFNWNINIAEGIDLVFTSEAEAFTYWRENGEKTLQEEED